MEPARNDPINIALLQIMPTGSVEQNMERETSRWVP